MQRATVMQLTSPAFHDGSEIPTKYTCEGADISPPLAWTDIPARTKSFTLIVEDPDASDETFVHWIVVDLPPERHTLHENIGKLASGHIGFNDWHRTTWGGPCPPSGKHHYTFKLYALDRMLDLVRPTRQELEAAMDGHVLAEATLVGTYHRHRRAL
jgi:Raf kinase inhibitor-like YbhB/YbcL family protein